MQLIRMDVSTSAFDVLVRTLRPVDVINVLVDSEPSD